MSLSLVVVLRVVVLTVAFKYHPDHLRVSHWHWPSHSSCQDLKAPLFFPRSDPLTYGACSTTISYFPLPSQGLSPHPLVSQHAGCDAHHDRRSSLRGCRWARTEPVAPAVPPHWHVPGRFDKSPCGLACFRTARAHVTGTHSCPSPSGQLSITPESSPSCLH